MEFTAEAIKTRLKNSLNSGANAMEGSFCMDNIGAVSQELARIYAQLIEPLYNNAENNERAIMGGNEDNYIYLAKQVEGVENARCIGCFNGAGTVKVVLIGADGAPPSAAVVTAATEHLVRNRPIGATVTVAAATVTQVSIAAEVQLTAGHSLTAVTATVRAALESYIKSLAYTAVFELSYYKIAQIIVSCEGVDDLISFTINGGSESITATESELFALSGVVLSES